MKKILKLFLVLAVMMSGLMLSQNVFSYDYYCNQLKVQGLKDSEIWTANNCDGPSDYDEVVKTPAQNVVNTLLYIVGILSVVMIIYGGIQYTTSAGDAAKVNKAKNTILYAVVGLIIAVLAYAIVNFVVGRL